MLHLSEYEKAVGGMQSSARTDGGATSRVVGSLLSWLADPHTIKPGVLMPAFQSLGTTELGTLADYLVSLK